MVIRRGGPWWVAVGLWTAAVAVPAAGGLAPGLLRMLYRLLAGLTWPIGVVCSCALLTATYYCVLTPIGLVQRLVGRDSMGRQFDRQATSYWVERRIDENIGRHFRQF